MGDLGIGEALAISGGMQAGGAVLGAQASKPKAISVPPPTPLFPGVQESYVNALTSSGVTPASFGTLSEAAQTGLPTDVGPAFEALKSSMGRGIEEGRTNLIEKYGAQGLRFSQPLLNAGVDFESQVQKDFASILADYTRQAGESASNRRVAAAVAGQGAAGELAGAFTPTAVVAGGGQSTVGSGLQAGGGAIQNLVLMKALFPDLFGGGGGGTNPTNPSQVPN